MRMQTFQVLTLFSTIAVLAFPLGKQVVSVECGRKVWQIALADLRREKANKRARSTQFVFGQADLSKVVWQEIFGQFEVVNAQLFQVAAGLGVLRRKLLRKSGVLLLLNVGQRVVQQIFAKLYW